MRFRMSAGPETFLAEMFLRCLPPNCWKDMQGKADETECPRSLAGRHRRQRKSKGIQNLSLARLAVTKLRGEK